MRTSNEPHTVEDMKTDLGVAADLIARHVRADVVNLLPDDVESAGPNGSDKLPVLVLPTGLKAQSIKPFLDEYRTAPERRRGTALLVEIDSFIAHVNRFKDADSALFARPATEKGELTTLLAVLDYHRQNRKVEDDEGSSEVEHGAPRFGTHRALYTFPASDEWVAWNEKSGVAQSQAEFASFLEDRIVDVADPQGAFTAARVFADALGISSFASASRLLELSRGLTVHVDERVTSKIDPSSGVTTMHFSTEHNDAAGAPLEVPRAFLIQIPVFRAGTAYQFAVRLKYRASGGKIAWSYELHEARKAFDDAFREACSHAEERTELPLFYGAPEV